MFEMADKMKRLRTWLIFALLFGCIFTTLSFSISLGASEQLRMAPVNPLLFKHQQQIDSTSLQYLFQQKQLILSQQKRLSMSQQEQTQAHPLGYMPPLFDSSYLSRLGTTLDLSLQPKTYPVSYDLRALGKVTSVKDQANCGACWAFATFGSTESCLLPAENRDFSENNLKNTHGFDWEWNIGGNAFMSAAYLTRWSGPVNETDDPYNDASGVSPTGLTTQKHVQEIIQLPDQNKDAIKNAVMTYGAVTTSMCWDEAIILDYNDDTSYTFNESNSAYWDFVTDDWKYYKGLNHMVTIVGWDDTYPKTKFNPCPSNRFGYKAGYPAGNGAWIVKNSWGTGWGEQGYFYVSYYDQNFARELFVFMNAESTENYQHQYEYDPYGLVNSFTPGGKTPSTAWAANVFLADANEPLVAVAFYALAPKTQYTVSVYTNVDTSANDPTKGTLVKEASTSGSIANTGYHTIKLPAPVQLIAGQKFSIVVKLTTPGYNYPIPFEARQIGLGSHADSTLTYTSKAASNPGESFYSSTGKTWTDFISESAVFNDDNDQPMVSLDHLNVCLKAFTRTAPVIFGQPASQTVGETQSATFSVTAVGTPIPNYQWYFKANGKDNYEAIGGALSSSYTINGVTTTNAGKYIVVIKNDKGETTSAEATLTVLPLVSTPTFNPDGGTYTNPWQIKVSCSTPGVTIRYTIDGSEPTEKSPVVASGGFVTVNKPDTTLKAKAWKTGWATSITKSDLFNITGTVTTPTFGLKPGLYKAAQDVAINCTNPAEADIYYTTDGTEPTVNSLPYTKGSSVHLDTGQVVTIKAKAWKKDWDVSATATATYTITGTVATPELSLGAGTYNGGTKVTATCTTTDAIIRYATGVLGKAINPTPTSPIIPKDGVVIGNNMSLTVMAFKTNWVNSQPVTANYTIDKVAAPVFSLAPGPYYKPQTVTISCATTGAKIYLVAEDGSESPYKTKISIPKGSATIRAYAKTTDGKLAQSDVSSVTYLVTGNVPTPTLTPSGTFVGSQTVEMACSPCDGQAPKIYYTVDGTEPTESSYLYPGKITIKDSDIYGPMTFKAKAFLKDWAPSAVASATYTPTVPKPEFNVASGEYESKQIVKIACPLKTGGVTIRYTTGDGKTPPTASSPIVPEDGIVVDRDMTILAAGFRTGWFTANTVKNGDSVAKASYTINKVADPVFSLAPGTYSKLQTLTISCATSGAQILYGISDGTVKPDPKPYKAGTKISLTTGTTLVAAMAMKDGKTQSAVVTAAYKVLGAITTAPTFSPASKTLAAGGSQKVTLGCATRGVSFIYTVDGSTPTLTNGLAYAGSIEITGTTTLKAIAVMDGCTPSPVATAVYTGTLDAPQFDPSNPKSPFASQTYIKVIGSTNQGAAIRYTTDGKNPSATSPLVPDNGILVNKNMTIKIQAFKTGWMPSAVMSSDAYTFTGVATPTFSIPGGTIKAPTTFTISCATAGAEIHFTYDPLAVLSQNDTKTKYVPGTKITINSSATFRAKAWLKTTGASSEEGSVTFSYTGTVTTPTLSVSAGSYSIPQKIAVGCQTIGANIYYTTNGTEPSATNGTKLSGDIPINATTTLKVKAFKDDWTPSATVTAVYTLYKVDAPTISPSNNTFNPGQPITLNCGTTGATIRYTTNGNDPSLSDPAVVPGTKINIGVGGVTIRARAWKTGLNPSDIVETTYQVKPLASEELNTRLASIDKFTLFSKYLHAKMYTYFFSGQFALSGSYKEDYGGIPDDLTWSATPDADGWYTASSSDSLPVKMKSPNPDEIYLMANAYQVTAKKDTDGLWNGTINADFDSEDTYETSSRSNTVKYHVKFAVTFTDADLKQGDGKYQVTGTITVGKTAYPITASYVLTYDAGLSEFHITGSQTFNKVAKIVDEMYLTDDVQSDEINQRIDSIQYFNLVQNYIRDKFTNFLGSTEHKFEPSGNAIGNPADTGDFDQAWSGPDSDGWYTYVITDKADDGTVPSTTTIKFKSVSANDIKLKVTSTRYTEDGKQLISSADLIVAKNTENRWSGAYNASYDTVQDNQVYHTDLSEQITDVDLASGAGNYGITATFQVQGGSYYGLTASYSVDQSRVFTVNQETFNACAVSVLTSKQINDCLASFKMFELVRHYVHDKFADYIFGFTNGQFMFAGPYQYYGNSLSTFTWSLPDKDGWYTAVVVDPHSKAKMTFKFQFLNSCVINFTVNALNNSIDFHAEKVADSLWKGYYKTNYDNTAVVNNESVSWRTEFSEVFEQTDLTTGAGKYTTVTAKFSLPLTNPTETHNLTANYEVTYDPATQKITVSGSELFDGNSYSPNDICTKLADDNGGDSGNDTGVSSPSQVNQLISTMPTFGLVDGYVKDKFANFLNSGKSQFAYNSSVTPSTKWVIPLNVQWWQQPVDSMDIPEGANTNDYIKFVNGGTAPTDASGAVWSDMRLLWNKVTKSYSLHFVRTFTTTLNGSPVQLTSTVDFDGSRTYNPWTGSYSWTGGYGTMDQDLAYDASQNKTLIYNTYLQEHFDNINLVTGQGKYYNLTATFRVQDEADAQYFYLSRQHDDYDPSSPAESERETYYQVIPDGNSTYKITGQETFNGTNIDNINETYNYR